METDYGKGYTYDELCKQKPGSYIATDNTALNPYTDYSDPSYNQARDHLQETDATTRKEMDKKRNLKIFFHFTAMFCTRFPNWQIEIDPTDVFGVPSLKHKKGWKLANRYPMNELEVKGSIPWTTVEANYWMGTNPRIPFPTFYGWALGVEDCPKWIQE